MLTNYNNNTKITTIRGQYVGTVVSAVTRAYLCGVCMFSLSFCGVVQFPPIV